MNKFHLLNTTKINLIENIQHSFKVPLYELTVSLIYIQFV